MAKRSTPANLDQKKLITIISSIVFGAAVLLYLFKPDLYAQLTGQAVTPAIAPTPSSVPITVAAPSTDTGSAAIQVFFTTPKYPDTQ
ncbi:MAG TPA: hypothetical protein VFK30_12255, partial [Anaerolineae bacterium]|nr:hypothetical protein [Anaerolineae bacterium]